MYKVGCACYPSQQCVAVVITAPPSCWDVVLSTIISTIHTHANFLENSHDNNIFFGQPCMCIMDIQPISHNCRQANSVILFLELRRISEIGMYIHGYVSFDVVPHPSNHLCAYAYPHTYAATINNMLS